MAGPYTAFTYGDPQEIYPTISVTVSMLYGDPGSLADSNPVIWSSGILSGSVGVAYSEAFSVTGGASPYTFALQSGSLPGGLTLSSAGVISGSPSASGTSSFAVSVTDSRGTTVTQTFSITIAAAGSKGANYIVIY